MTAENREIEIEITMTARKAAVSLLLALLVCPWGALAQQTSGMISGTIQDSQGAVVPNARVVLINQAQATNFREMTSSNEGTFVFTPVPAGTFTVTVEAAGFKKYVRPDVVLNAGARVGLPPIVLEVGAVGESITVMANAPQLQTLSAERSGVVTGKQLTDLASLTRDWTAFLVTVPGISPDDPRFVNGARRDGNTLMIDGVTAMDTGNNSWGLVRLNPDAIAEFRVITNSKQAEYGRSTGANVALVTRGGAKDFHGTGYWFRRHESMNANTWTNNYYGRQVPLYRHTTVGFNLSGPAYIPGKFNRNKDRLFFFASGEFLRPLNPGTLRSLTVPTDAERRGDFSLTKDGSGIPVIIKDPANGSAPFPGNQIPSNRQHPLGLKILNWLPKPDPRYVADADWTFNYQTLVGNKTPQDDTVWRVDYNPSDNWKFYFRLITNRTRGEAPYGSLSSGNNIGLSPFLTPFGGIAGMGNLTIIITPTLTNEFIYGNSRNWLPVLFPSDSLFLRANAGFSLPLIYPDADPTKVIPNLNFGTLPNGPTMDFRGLPYDNENPTVNWTNNLSKVFARHTLKAGFFLERSLKRQTAEAPNNGTYWFNRDASNPYDTNWDFSNALIGSFQRFQQGNKLRKGFYRYTIIEWYVQDNWKLRSNLTVDYGMRFSLFYPWYEQNNILSTFYAAEYKAADMVRLYQPTLVGGKKAALNPVTGQTTIPNLIGAIVPDVGNPFNGMATQNKGGYDTYLINKQGLLLGPRLGLAWTPAGPAGKTVVRLGGGVFYDRTQNNFIAYQIPNPPGTLIPQVYYGTFDTIGATGQTFFPFAANSMSKDGHIPTTYNWNFTVQRQMPWSVLVEVGYVGMSSSHQINNRPMNEPAPGSAWLPQNQDPTAAAPKFDGTTTLPMDMTRPYQGYSSITEYATGGSSNYNALQVSVNRRMSKNMTFGVNYTWSKALGVAGQMFDPTNPWDARKADYGPLPHDRTQYLTIDYIYTLPKPIRGGGMARSAAGLILNDWQLSGIVSLASGGVGNLSYGITGVGTALRNRMITGVETVAPRVVMTCEPNLSPGDRRLDAWVKTSCIQPAAKGSWGMDSGNRYIRWPGTNNWNTSLFKNIHYSQNEARYIQLRLETYNTFNHTQWSGFNSSAIFDSAGKLTNLPTALGGGGGRFGFGALNSVRSPRFLQIAAKIYF